jgi:hypothetical protein
VAVSGCGAVSESFVLTMLVLSTSMLVSEWLPPWRRRLGVPTLGYPKCSPCESHRYLFRSDDGGVINIATSLEVPS